MMLCIGYLENRPEESTRFSSSFVQSDAPSAHLLAATAAVWKELSRVLGWSRGDLIEVANQTEWPGTKLMGFSASVHSYRVTPELIAVLKTKVNSLYAWAVPDLPEDLAFYWPDGSAPLGTSSHERFAFLNLTEKEIDEFKQEVPGVRLSKFPRPALV